jgi:predicted HTH domain antitoxin
MQSFALDIKIPSAITQFGISKEDIQNHIEEWLVLSLFTQERISSGKAAQLLNISRIEFLKRLHRYHINYFNYSNEELAEEFDAIKHLPLKPITLKLNLPY